MSDCYDDYDNLSDCDAMSFTNDQDIDSMSDSEDASRQAMQIDYQALSPADLSRLQQQEIDHVVKIIELSQAQVATLLRAYRWNKERVVEKYIDDPERVLSRAGIIINSQREPVWKTVSKFSCPICCEGPQKMDTLALSCHHVFCVECFSHYVEHKIREEGESRGLQCPGARCKVAVDAGTVRRLASDEIYNRYQVLLTRTFVDDNPALKWCPAPNCEFAIECSIPQSSLKRLIPTVTCACGTRFCHGCGYADHRPCPCGMVKRWLKKCQDDSETANWINSHTKDCPKCKNAIEKNGGCNHMTCRSCRHEFCWVCMGLWSEHGTNWYSCNRYEEKESEDAISKSRASLERYLHYYNRYANHENSSRLETKQYEAIEKKMEDLQRVADISWIQCQFLHRAVQVLSECRATLKWTYAFAYYLERNNMTILFEDNQRDLELAVEQLSEFLEMPLEKMLGELAQVKRNMLDKTVYVEKRHTLLLDDTLNGLAEDRWTFVI